MTGEIQRNESSQVTAELPASSSSWLHVQNGLCTGILSAVVSFFLWSSAGRQYSAYMWACAYIQALSVVTRFPYCKDLVSTVMPAGSVQDRNIYAWLRQCFRENCTRLYSGALLLWVNAYVHTLYCIISDVKYNKTKQKKRDRLRYAVICTDPLFSQWDKNTTSLGRV